MLSKGQGVTISGFGGSLICINVVLVIWRWPDYHVFAWFGLIWLAVACFTCMYLIVNKDRLWSFAALVVSVFAFFINCSYLGAITAHV